eukprot:TRINITY_DN10650_c0_g1_i1.p1 TRINITY_DN10650_c0_g1~~TRINITY_DN10650_c0_g1_i1.p1  ORF type:complete len:159 (+),score=29.12 TRINITY_DN10650_c0_g1_i1:52-528(+)
MDEVTISEHLINILTGSTTVNTTACELLPSSAPFANQLWCYVLMYPLYTTLAVTFASALVATLFLMLLLRILCGGRKRNNVSSFSVKLGGRPVVLKFEEDGVSIQVKYPQIKSFDGEKETFSFLLGDENLSFNVGDKLNSINIAYKGRILDYMIKNKL